jgi:uncharacterized cupin superfamily protein
MPKLDLSAIPFRYGSGYPGKLAEAVAGRSVQNLGDAGGLTQFGAKMIRLEPGAWSSHRHWHENEDECVLMIEGELVMVENEGETIMRKGDVATYKAGVANGHHLINRTDKAAIFLVIGTRTTADRGHYPDTDLLATKNGASYVFTKKDGSAF